MLNKILVRIHKFIYDYSYKIPYVLYDRFQFVKNMDYPSNRLIQHCMNLNIKRPHRFLAIVSIFSSFRNQQGTESAIDRCMLTFENTVTSRERLRMIISKFVRDTYNY